MTQGEGKIIKIWLAMGLEVSERSRRRSGEASKPGGQAVSFSLRSRIGLFPPSVRMVLLLLH